MKRLLEAAGPWNTRRITALAITTLLGGAIAYMANVWLMAHQYDGSNEVGDTPVSVGPNALQGMIVWFLICAIGSAIVTQLIVAGPRTVAHRAIDLPQRLRGMVSQLGARWYISILYGVGAALLLGAVGIPALRGVVGLGILLFLPTAVGHALVSLVAQIVAMIARAGSRFAASPLAVTETWMIGMAAGFVIGYFLSWTVLRIALAAVLVAVAARQSRRPSLVGTAAVLAGTLVVIDWLYASHVLADDGGWKECGSSWGGFFGCDGSEKVFGDAAGGGIAGGAGGAAGGILGGAGGPGGDKPKPKPEPGDKPKPKPEPGDKPEPEFGKRPGYDDKPKPEFGTPRWTQMRTGGLTGGGSTPTATVVARLSIATLTGDGAPDTTLLDTDGDGIHETRDSRRSEGDPHATGVDTDGDELPDRWYNDEDGDGLPDTEGRDTDGDGRPDRWRSRDYEIRDADHDNIPDS